MTPTTAETVFVIEDDLGVQKLLLRTLSQYGFAPLAFGDG